MKKLTTLVIALVCSLFTINTVEAASKNRAENLAEEMAERGEKALKKLNKGEFEVSVRQKQSLQQLFNEFIAKSELLEELLDENKPNLAEVKILADQALNLTLQIQKIAFSTKSKELQNVSVIWTDVASRLVAEVKGLIAEQKQKQNQNNPVQVIEELGKKKG